MKHRSTSRRRGASHAAALFGILASCGLLAARSLGVHDGPWLLAVENPPAGVLESIAARPEVDVRWAEPGLLLCEVGKLDAWRAAWGGRVLCRRDPGFEIGVVRATDATWIEPSVASEGLPRAARLGVLRTDAGDVWVGAAPPDAWPDALVGCAGPLGLAGHRLDPRSLLDRGAPAALRPWAEASPRPFTSGESRFLQTISTDSLAYYLNMLALDPAGRPAKRWVFSPDLDGFYAPRVERVMQRAVAGLPGATVTRQWFAMRRECHVPGAAGDSVYVVVDSTYNVVAHLPGNVSGLGTFVLGAHLDATGANDSTWVSAGLTCPAEYGSTPGAEDNASGVACVLEMLRDAADAVRRGDVAFAFDLDFVAFSGEERQRLGQQGQLLEGSAFYVKQKTDARVPLLGAFILDMVGYDSDGGASPTLEIVRNPASRWLEDVVRAAQAALVPPTTLAVVTEVSRETVSDHNSFWTVNAPALLGSDANVTAIRNYHFYHRPSDLTVNVNPAQLHEVTRLMAAALARFDTRAYAEPHLAIQPGDLVLQRQLQGTWVDYTRNLRIWPGTALRAQLHVHSLGKPYDGRVRVEILKRSHGEVSTVYSQADSLILPTGDTVSWTAPVGLGESDAGSSDLVASVSYKSTSGADSVASASIAFNVEQQTTLQIAVWPNPARRISPPRLVFGLDRPGAMHLELFDVRGRRVNESTRDVEPSALKSQFDIPLFPSGKTDVPSGHYVVRASWRGAGGRSFTSTTPLVILK